MSQKLIFGIETKNVKNIREKIEDVAVDKIDFLCVPLFHPRLRKDSIGVSEKRTRPATRSDRELESKDWISNVVGYISEWIDLDNSNERIIRSSENCLRQELQWSIHLGLQAIVLPPPKSLISPNYSRCLQQLCSNITTYQQIWVRIPLVVPFDYRVSSHSTTDGWRMWDNLRHLTGHNHRLSIALELSNDIPEDIEDSMERWTGEPVKAILLPTRIFLTNKSGYPVLSKRHQLILSKLLHFKLHIIFSGKSRHEDSYVPYLQYIRHLQSRDKTPLSEGELFTNSYKDTLQAPLQPLMDNLESQTYETFERDPVKYERYEAAISLALEDISIRNSNDVADNIPVNPALQPNIDNTLVVTVVGAGRGPLVAAALSASSSTGVPIRVYAIEKNENAIITLRNRAQTEFWTNVTIIEQDIRAWHPIELADIIVSELLGSWGDNELSPECLDGAQKCLRLGGISIPCSYTSYIAPVSSSKLWMGARDMLEADKSLETPYVVKFHNCYQIAEAKPLFHFVHPNYDSKIDNNRFSNISFTASTAVTIHGMSGSFECSLYKDIMISIMPSSHTEGMFSWFPLFIPFKSPLYVEKGGSINISVWRCVDSRKVWYEWCLTEPVCTQIQNPNGRSYWIGLH